MDSATLNTIITIVTPAIIGLIKLFVPKLPSGVPLILAPVLGAGMEVANAALGDKPMDPTTGMLYGALGVYLREVVDQSRKVAGKRPDDTTTTTSAVLAMLAVAGSLFLGACGLQNPFGGTGNDDVLYAGDLGGAVCIGVVTFAAQENQPQWIDQARTATAAAKGVLATHPASYDALRDALIPMVPAKYGALAGYFFDRLGARAADGLLAPDSDAFKMAEAFITECEKRLPTE